MSNVEAFINYGINKEVTVTRMKKAIWGLLVFYMLGFFYGVMLGGVILILGIIILGIGVISAVCVQIVGKNNSIQSYFKVLGITSFSGMINFSLLSLMLCQMLKTKILVNAIVIITPIIMMSLLYFITIRRIKKGSYQNTKKVYKSNIFLYSTIGAVAGFGYARIFFKDTDQSTALIVMIISFMFLSLAFCLGTINLLKLLYIRKYNIKEGGE